MVFSSARPTSLRRLLSAATLKSSSVSPYSSIKSSSAPLNLHPLWSNLNSTSTTSLRIEYCKTRQFHTTPAKMVQQISTREQYDNVLEKAGDKLVVIDFFATWCGPCKIIAPQVEKLSKEFEEVEFYKLDVDEHQQIAAELAVRAMPTFLFFKNGKKLTDDVVGANVKALRAAIEKHRK
ncbi:thioredoxin-like protein [Trichophaea hybrida]|nr:thioredoxin-like protein [Trichophaea hybrida]